MQIEGALTCLRAEIPVRPQLRLPSTKRIARSSVGHHHELILGSPIEQLTGRAGPCGCDTACGGDLPHSARAGKRPNVDLESASVIGLVRQPSPVGRKGGFPLHGWSAEKDFRSARLPPGRLITFDRDGHRICAGLRTRFLEREDPAIGVPGCGGLRVFAMGQPVSVTGAVARRQYRFCCFSRFDQNTMRRPSGVQTGFSFCAASIVRREARNRSPTRTPTRPVACRR